VWKKGISDKELINNLDMYDVAIPLMFYWTSLVQLTKNNKGVSTEALYNEDIKNLETELLARAIDIKYHFIRNITLDGRLSFTLPQVH
jgi:hypothetical protein